MMGVWRDGPPTCVTGWKCLSNAVDGSAFQHVVFIDFRHILPVGVDVAGFDFFAVVVSDSSGFSLKCASGE